MRHQGLSRDLRQTMGSCMATPGMAMPHLILATAWHQAQGSITCSLVPG